MLAVEAVGVLLYLRDMRQVLEVRVVEVTEMVEHFPVVG
jgi:hypothetical protein